MSAPTPTACTDQLTRHLPARQDEAANGSKFAQEVMAVSGKQRDAAVVAQILSGNIPSFLRRLKPVHLSGKLSDGQEARVVVCVTPDYLAVGSDQDFVRMPLGLPAAAIIADRFRFLLPTTRMVDAIHAQARVLLKPSPMKPTSRMRTTAYLWQHNRSVEHQRRGLRRGLGALTAGQKKDLVLSNRLRRKPGRVAIYGWHRRSGVPIQPLSTVHAAQYADYSHGVRLVSATAFVNGVARSLTTLLQDARYAPILSSEGPIANADALLTSMHRHSGFKLKTASLPLSDARPTESH